MTGKGGGNPSLSGHKGREGPYRLLHFCSQGDPAVRGTQASAAAGPFGALQYSLKWVPRNAAATAAQADEAVPQQRGEGKQGTETRPQIKQN